MLILHLVFVLFRCFKSSMKEKECNRFFGCKRICPLAFRLDSMKEFQKANQQQHEKHQQSRDDSIKTIERLEGSSGGIAERYKFLQEMRGYVQDLLECFNEKVRMQILFILFSNEV